MAPKDPKTLIEYASVNKRNSSMEISLTCPLYAMEWQGDGLIVGGGSPPGYGQGRPLGFINPDWDSNDFKNKYKYTGDEYVEKMSRVVPFKNFHMAATVMTERLNFTLFDQKTMEWREIAEYRRHVNPECVEEGTCEARVVAIAPSGRVVVTNADDQALHVVVLQDDPNSESGFRTRCAAILEGHTKSIGSVAIAPLAPPEGVSYKPERPGPLLIASVSDDNTLRLWRSGDYPLTPDAEWVEQITRSSCPAGIISLEQPPHFPHNDDPQKKFRLQVVRFSNKGTELHIIMARGGGPCFLVTYAIRWTVDTNKQTGKKRYNLSCSTLASVELERTDAVTTFELTPCDGFLVYGTADDSHVGVASTNGDVVCRLRNHHEGPINLVALKKITPRKFLLATHGFGGVPKVKIQQIEIREGMSPGEVLQVITGLVALFFLVVYLVGSFVTGPELFDCLWDGVVNAASLIKDGDVSSARALFARPEPELPGFVLSAFPAATLHTLRLSDPVVMGALFGLPAAAAALVCLVSLVDPVPLYALACFAAGAFAGDAVLELLPLSFASISSFQYLVACYLLLFLFDSATRSPPPDPSLQQNVFKIHRKKGDKLGLVLNTAESGMQNQINFVVRNSICEKAGLTGGMTIVKVNGAPVPADKVLDELVDLHGDISIEVVKNSKSQLALALDQAYKPCILAGLLQHMYLVLRLAGSTQPTMAVTLGLHAVLYEIANVAVLLCCNIDHVRVVVIRVLVAQVWCAMAVGAIDREVSEALAPWLLPATAAASLYMAFTHLLPALLTSEKYGAFGVVLQVGALVLGLAAHSYLG